MASTVTGNVGGSGFSGAQIQATHVRNNNITFTVADGSGNYSLSLSVAGPHIIRAMFNGYVYYHPVQVIVDGTSTYSGINLNPTALNASNTTTEATNF